MAGRPEEVSCRRDERVARRHVDDQSGSLEALPEHRDDGFADVGHCLPCPLHPGGRRGDIAFGYLDHVLDTANDVRADNAGRCLGHVELEFPDELGLGVACVACPVVRRTADEGIPFGAGHSHVEEPAFALEVIGRCQVVFRSHRLVVDRPWLRDRHRSQSLIASWEEHDVVLEALCAVDRGDRDLLVVRHPASGVGIADPLDEFADSALVSLRRLHERPDQGALGFGRLILSPEMLVLFLEAHAQDDILDQATHALLRGSHRPPVDRQECLGEAPHFRTVCFCLGSQACAKAGDRIPDGFAVREQGTSRPRRKHVWRQRGRHGTGHLLDLLLALRIGVGFEVDPEIEDGDQGPDVRFVEQGPLADDPVGDVPPEHLDLHACQLCVGSSKHRDVAGRDAVPKG